jgi:curved DNA binding protein
MMEEDTPASSSAAVPASGGAAGGKKVEAVVVTDLSSSDVQTKYREAAGIANAVLAQVLAKLAPGVLVSDVCAFGDSAIEEAVSKVFKSKKDMEKGVAFPTCVSLNTTVAHYSPLKSESKTLAAGDAVKVDLGVHIDGYIALVAHTVVLGAGPGAPVGGAQGDVMAAAHAAAEVATRLIKPGSKNSEVTEAIEAIAAAYGVKPMAAVQCSQLKRFELDSGKGVPLKRDPAEGKYETATFEANEVYAVEIAFTSGEGKTRETEQRTTVFKRAPLVSGAECVCDGLCGRVGPLDAVCAPRHTHISYVRTHTFFYN